MSFNLSLSPWSGQSLIGKILSISLTVVILGAIGTLVYFIATPKAGEKFTEFYILGLESKATDYPKEVEVGQEGRVIVAIINQERQRVIYQVKVEIDGVMNNQVGPLELGHDEKWEGIVSFTPDRVGGNQKVEFLLFKNGESKPHLNLYLWIDVKERK